MSFGHNYFVLNKFNEQLSRLKCKSCKKQFLFNIKGEIIDLTKSDSKSSPVIEYI